jgi:basic membrane protein A and related proteins
LKKRKFGLTLSLVLAAGTILGACGSADNNENEKTGAGDEKGNKFSVAMVTDVGGVDDKSFNQSAWEGLKEFGKDNGFEQGKGGYDYLQSKSDADYATNLNKLAREGFSLIFGIGYKLKADIDKIAQQQKDTHFGIVDDIVEQPNVVSVMFKEQEASFLAGVAAAKATKSNHVGFIGGMESPVIERFEAGFRAGIQTVNPDIKVDVHYTGAFDKAELGKATAAQMYSSGADIIIHAAGQTGVGLFTEAKDLKKKDPQREIWAIGVDMDQSNEGVVEVNGEEHNVVLTSAMKGVKTAIIDVSEKSMNGEFPGGEILRYGLAEEGVELAPINEEVANKAEIEAAVNEWVDKIKNGEITVPETVADLKNFKAQ